MINVSFISIFGHRSRGGAGAGHTHTYTTTLFCSTFALFTSVICVNTSVTGSMSEEPMAISTVITYTTASTLDYARGAVLLQTCKLKKKVVLMEILYFTR